jgi:hypothetical protein
MVELRSSNTFPINSRLLTTTQFQSKCGSKESAPEPPKPPWIAEVEAPGTVLLSNSTPATAFSDPSGVYTSTALCVFSGVVPTSVPPKPTWMLSAGDEVTDVAVGLTLGVWTRDRCGRAQDVATGGELPRATPGWTRTGMCTLVSCAEESAGPQNVATPFLMSAL